MNVSINFDTDGAAFEYLPRQEAEYVIGQAVHAIFEEGETFGHLRDTNGNTVGTFDVTGA